MPVVQPKGFGSEQTIASMLIAYVADKTVISLSPDSEQMKPQCGSHNYLPKDLLSERSESSESHGSERAEKFDDGAGYEDEDADEYEEYEDEDDYEDEEYSEKQPMYVTTAVERYSILTGKVLVQEGFDYEELFFGVNPSEDGEQAPAEDEWLDVPPDAHILAGRRPWPAVLLPIVCVTDGLDIVPLVASCIYQRAAWGIDLPVVGLQIQADKGRALVWIGWMDAEKVSAALTGCVTAEY